MRSRVLPERIAGALARALEGVSRKALAERARRLSESYRATGSAAPRDDLDALAYAVARAPATFAAVSAALDWVLRAAPDFAPSALLDLGSGTGAALWAAAELFPELRSMTALERDPFMARLAAALDPDPRVRRQSGDATSAAGLPDADLVMASYVLAEIAEASRAEVIACAWSAARGALLLVEPGTPAGWARILAARSQLLAAGARLLAPCPHDQPCPLLSPDWCHFAARAARSRDHKLLKGAEVPFEDEKFAYLAAARFAPAKLPSGRILVPPSQGKPGLTLSLCRNGKVEAVRVPSRDKAAFRAARKLAWGDATDL